MLIKQLKIFTGNANPELMQRTCNILAEKGYDDCSSNIRVEEFRDGEIDVELLDNVRGYDCYIVQSSSRPTNKHLMELVLIIDALKRASANRITAVIPYFGYSRQDRRVRSTRVPISAKVVADMICNVGVDRLVTIDLHSEQIQGFFNVAVDNIYAAPIFIRDIQEQNYVNPLVVSPDVGGVVRARAVAKALDNTDLAIIDKRRPEANVSEVMNIIGEVEGRTCILIDDMIDTAGTLCKAADALMDKGALKVVAYCCHPVLSSPAIETINNSQLDSLIVTDSITLRDDAVACKKIRQLTLADILGEAIDCIHNDKSMRYLFQT